MLVYDKGIKMALVKKIIKEIIGVIPRIFVHVDEKDILSSTKWIHQLSRLYYQIILKIPNTFFQHFIAYYTETVKKVALQDRKNEAIIKEEWLTCFRNANDETKMFIVGIFYYSNIFDESISKTIMEYALSTSHKTNRYWIAMDISKISFILQKGLYEDFYKDRQKLLYLVATDWGLQIPQNKKVKNNGCQRLLIITYLLDASIGNSMQRVAAMVANGMQPHFQEILVLSLESFYVAPNESHQLTTNFRHKLSRNMHNQISSYFDENVSIKYVCGNSILDRLQNSLDIIYTYNPDVIFDISDEYSAVSYWYSKDYFTCYIPLRTLASSVFYSAIQGEKWIFEEGNKRFNSIDLDKVINWSFPEYVPPKTPQIPRNQIGVADDSFVIISIGNNCVGVGEKFIDEVCDMLKRNKNFVWLLVGAPASDYLHEKYEALLESQQVIEWGYEKRLYGLCLSCDVVLRSNMTGGSGGTAIAAMAGLPIAMTNYLCDSMRWLGREYSRISSYHELMKYIERLAYDKEFYTEQSQIVYKLVNDASNTDILWKTLANEVKRKAVQRFE